MPDVKLNGIYYGDGRWPAVEFSLISNGETKLKGLKGSCTEKYYEEMSRLLWMLDKIGLINFEECLEKV